MKTPEFRSWPAGVLALLRSLWRLDDAAALSFAIGPVPIKLRPSFLWWTAWLGEGRGAVSMLAWLILALVAVLAHELGHAGMALSMSRQPSIQLLGVVGLTLYPRQPRLTPRQELFISLAGPLAGAATGTIGWALLQLAGIHGALQHDLLWVTFGWSAVNLIPLKSLDGGEAAEQLLTMASGSSWTRVGAALSGLVWLALLVVTLKAGLVVSSITTLVLLASQAALVFLLARQATPASDVSIEELELVESIIADQKANRHLAKLEGMKRLERMGAVHRWQELVDSGRTLALLRLLEKAKVDLQQDPGPGALDEFLRGLALVPANMAASSATTLVGHLSFIDQLGLAAEVCFRLPIGVRLMPITLGGLVASLGDPARALRILEAVPPRAEGDHAAHRRLWALLALGRSDEAVALVSGELGGRVCKDALGPLARLAQEQGHPEIRLALVERWRGRDQTATSSIEWAAALVSVGRLDDADRVLLELGELEPSLRRHLSVHPEMEPLRGRPGFEAAIAKPIEVKAKPWPDRPRVQAGAAGHPIRLPEHAPLAPVTPPRLEIPGRCLFPSEWRLAFVDDPEQAAALVTEGWASVGLTRARIVRHQQLADRLWLLELEGVSRLAATGTASEAKAAPEALIQAFRAMLQLLPEAESTAEVRLEQVRDARELADLIGATLQVHEPLRQRLLGTTDIETQLELAETLLQQVRSDLIHLPPVRCPACQVEPPASARWECGHSNGTLWNPFLTAGVCPGCGKAHALTTCQACSLPSRHKDWYLPTANASVESR